MEVTFNSETMKALNSLKGEKSLASYVRYVVDDYVKQQSSLEGVVSNGIVSTSTVPIDECGKCSK